MLKVKITFLISFSLLAGFILIVVVWYTVEVIQARLQTPAMIENLIKSDKIQLHMKDFHNGSIDMLLAVEDPRFYEHNGMDLSTPGAGITTITQGMVKYLYFERFKPGIAKLKQTLIAIFALNAMVPKETQLLIFINTVYLGHYNGEAVRGFSQAAKIYFDKPFADLTEEEYLSLVAMIIAPNSFNVKKQPQANAVRVQRIKRLLGGEYTPKGLMDLYYDK